MRVQPGDALVEHVDDHATRTAWQGGAKRARQKQRRAQINGHVPIKKRGVEWRSGVSLEKRGVVHERGDRTDLLPRGA